MSKLIFPTAVLDQHLVMLGKTGAGNLSYSINLDWLWVPAIIATITSVIRLFFRRRPAAIIRRIRPVVIRVSVKGMAGTWALTHVPQKVFKVVFPVIAYRNTATAIFWEILPPFVVTTIFHSFPSGVFDCISKSVCSILHSGHSTDTAARYNSSAPQMILPHRFFSSTCAPTQPKSMSCRPLQFQHYCQFSELMSNKVWGLFHREIIAGKVEVWGI